MTENVVVAARLIANGFKPMPESDRLNAVADGVYMEAVIVGNHVLFEFNHGKSAAVRSASELDSITPAEMAEISLQDNLSDAGQQLTHHGELFARTCAEHQILGFTMAAIPAEQDTVKIYCEGNFKTGADMIQMLVAFGRQHAWFGDVIMNGAARLAALRHQSKNNKHRRV